MEENQNRQQLCKKCLLKDMTGDEYFKDLYQYIERIDIEQKVEGIEYKRRLEICKECDKLVNGMCTICGCFVELRAALKIRTCPHINNKWG